MPLPTPSFDIFVQFETLNGSPLDTAGEWKLLSAPTNPVTICTSDGTWTAQTLNHGDVLYAGLHNPQIDFSGTSCAGSASPDGTYIFEYSITGGSCPSSSEFTIQVLDGAFTASLERTPDVCLIEMYSENPDTSGSKRAKVELINVNRMCVKLSLRTLVKRKNLDGCSSPITTLLNQVKIYGDFEVNATNLPNPLGDTFPFNVPYPVPQNLDGKLAGLFLMHKWVIQVGGWTTGDYIESVKVGRASGFPNTHETLDLSTVVATGNLDVSANLTTFVNGLRARIANRLAALGASNTNALFLVEGIFNGPNPEVHISFLCVHIPNDEWFGIDKNDWEVVYWDNGGTNEVVETNFDNDFVSMVQYGLDYTYMYDEYTMANCKFYTTSSSCNLLMFNRVCSSDLSDIYDFADSNYDFLDVITNVNARANILDFDNVCLNLPS